MMKFNDDYYCASVEEWENERIPHLLGAKRWEWLFRLFPALLVAGFLVAGGSWKLWVCFALFTYTLVTVFTFLEELNENIRFVRHQIRAFRHGVRKVNEDLNRYGKDPEGNYYQYDVRSCINDID